MIKILNKTNCLQVLLLLSMAIVGCKKYDVKTPDFKVNLVPGDYKVGDSVRFALTGNPDVISFYAGNVGNDYNSIQPIVIANKVSLSFKARRLNAGQENQLSVLVSSDFVGNTNGIATATWIDITSRISLPVTTGVSTDIDLDVTDLVIDHKPLYIAFKYNTESSATAGSYSQWEIKDVLLKRVNDREAVNFVEHNITTGWFLQLSSNYESGRVTNSNVNGINFMGNLVNTLVDTEAWVITKRVYPYQYTTYKGDFAIGIKSTYQTAINQYATVYLEEGAYTAVFVGQNIISGKSEQAVQKVNVTIKP